MMLQKVREERHCCVLSLWLYIYKRIKMEKNIWQI